MAHPAEAPYGDGNVLTDFLAGDASTDGWNSKAFVAQLGDGADETTADCGRSQSCT